MLVANPKQTKSLGWSGVLDLVSALFLPKLGEFIGRSQTLPHLYEQSHQQAHHSIKEPTRLNLNLNERLALNTRNLLNLHP
jgi:hypothetical protein